MKLLIYSSSRLPTFLNRLFLFFFLSGSGTDPTSLLILLSCWGERLQKILRLRRFKSDLSETGKECSSSRYASTDEVRFSNQRHTFKMAATTSFHAEKWCHLVLPASNSIYSSWSIVHSQGVYIFNQADFQGDSRRDFKKNPGHVCLASASYVMYRIYYYLMEHVMMSSYQKYDMHFIQHGAAAKIK